jgi:glycosyltransferase involved in cell wall biosynthesis
MGATPTGASAEMSSTSVLIPAYRAEAFIRRAVESALSQTVSDVEVVIASDDGQDYGALLRAQGIRDSRLFCVSTGGVRRGAGCTRNAAFQAAQGDVIVGLDADDALLPHHLECMVPLALAHGVAVSQVEYVDHHSGERLASRAKPFVSAALPLRDVLLACLHTYAPVAFDRRRIHHQWNVRVPRMSDLVFLAECYNSVPAVWYSAEPSYRYFRHGESLCNTPDAPRRFLEAGRLIRAALQAGEISSRNPEVATVLRAFIARNDQVEIAFEQALERGEVKDYHEFSGRNLSWLHSPLCGG